MLLSINICKNAKKNSLFNLKLSFRAVGLCWPSFRHPPGPEDRELHECCENFLFWIRSVKWFIDSPVIKSTMIYGDLLAFSVFSGGLRWQRCRLPHGLSAETCWHEGQQTRNESHALRCDGKMNLSFFLFFSSYTKQCSILFLLHDVFPFHLQQAQKSDAALLNFPEKLAHIGDASRYNFHRTRLYYLLKHSRIRNYWHLL